MSSARLDQDPIALAELFGLLVECPMHGGNPPGCQLHHVRELSLHDRYEWAKGLRIADANRIRTTCSLCMAQLKDRWRT